MPSVNTVKRWKHTRPRSFLPGKAFSWHYTYLLGVFLLLVDCPDFPGSRCRVALFPELVAGSGGCRAAWRLFFCARLRCWNSGDWPDSQNASGPICRTECRFVTLLICPFFDITISGKTNDSRLIHQQVFQGRWKSIYSTMDTMGSYKKCNILEWVRIPGEKSSSLIMMIMGMGGSGGNYQLPSIFHVSGSRICVFLKLLFLTCPTSLNCPSAIAW